MLACHLQPATPAGALRGHERQHVDRADPSRRLGNDSEEDLQIVGNRQHRVRTASPRQKLQILIKQRHTKPHHKITS
jgi:hypothetical protein